MIVGRDSHQRRRPLCFSFALHGSHPFPCPSLLVPSSFQYWPRGEANQMARNAAMRSDAHADDPACWLVAIAFLCNSLSCFTAVGTDTPLLCMRTAWLKTWPEG